MRRRGVFGYNLAGQTSNVVLPANLGIVGVVGRFARGLTDKIQINQGTEVLTKLGGHKSGFWGKYVLDSFFANLRGQGARVWVKPYVATDAVQASSIVVDQGNTPASVVLIKAGFQGIDDKSADGNLTGYTIEATSRFTTTTIGGSHGDEFLVLASVVNIRVGSVLKINSSPHPQYRKVTSIDESQKKVYFSALSSNVGSMVVIEDIGFKIITFRKNRRGIASRVDIPENNIVLSLEPENSEFFIGNAFAQHPYLKITSGVSTADLDKKYPLSVTSPVFLTDGADGTPPANASDWNSLLSFFDNIPVRMIFNTDSVLSGVNLGGEEYCGSRLDSPIWLGSVTKNQNKDQLVVQGRLYQRSNQVQSVIFASFRSVRDPIGFGANPVIDIPVHGAVAGAWIRAIQTLGFHRVPAGDDVPLVGFVETPTSTEDKMTEDERTEILEAGLNLVQFVEGRGVIVRSFRTPSTDITALFGHYLLMQNFIKISTVESLYREENRPNRLSAIKENGEVIRDFGRKLYEGSYPFGIDINGAFGDFIKDDGTESRFDDVFTVQADEFNNTSGGIAVGESNIFVRFYPPSLNESMAIGVGVLIPL
jgi:hypothetical protein